MTDLSPAAQAVLDAITKELDEAPWDVSFLAGVSAAAALRAIADLPNELEIPFNVITDWETIPGTCANFYAAAEWGYNQALAAQRAIPAELEAR